MKDVTASVIANLVSRGWTYSPAPLSDSTLPRALEEAPDALLEWTSSFSKLASPNEVVWFLSRDDYVSRTEEGFAWNTFEAISLEAVNSHAEAVAIAEFWDTHFPFLLSVRGHYSFLAVRADGVIVHGEEPEFEETSVVAPSLAYLLDLLARGPADCQKVIERLVFSHVNSAE